MLLSINMYYYYIKLYDMLHCIMGGWAESVLQGWSDDCRVQFSCVNKTTEIRDPARKEYIIPHADKAHYALSWRKRAAPPWRAAVGGGQ